MKQDKFRQVTAATRALYLREFQQIGTILTEEAALRAKLTRLSDQIHLNRGAVSENHTMRALGADLLWQGWTSRTGRQLNVELAQVMARKMLAMDRVRAAFGRQEAVEMLWDAEKGDQKRRREKFREENLFLSR